MTERLIRVIREYANEIDDQPNGRLQIDWQDGRPVHVEVTKRFRPK